MATLTRRSALALALGGTLGAVPFMARAARPRVVVVGGGAGGASAARRMALDDTLDAQVTLVEPQRIYHTCFFSNLYLGGLRDYVSLAHDYVRLAALPRLHVVHEWVRDVDRAARTVTLGSGAKLRYDRLLLSPGITLDYESVPGYSLAGADRAPHAWKSGTQLRLLRAKALAMKPGGTFVMVAPPDPSRCPPGPYERVSMLAHLFRSRNPTAKIVVLDPKERFAKQALFQQAWERHYPGMILWLPPSMSGGLTQLDLGTLSFRTALENFRADAASVVPAQRAAALAARAGLTDASGWCPVAAGTFQSAMDPHVHVVGDAAIAGAMPKSAFAANNQAHAAADAIRRTLRGEEMQRRTYTNTCWSQLASDDSVKIGGFYRPGENGIEATGTFISQLDETAATRAATAREAAAWYDAIVKDMFG